MKSVMSHNFSQVPSVQIPRSVFNRSHGHKTTFDEDWLIPIFVDEALPGDTFHLNTTLLARLLTPLTPVMDNMYLDTFYFAVPNRLLWDNWQAFCGERASPVADYSADTDYLIPQVEAPSGGWALGSIADYFGLPLGINNADVSALFFRAYNLIYQEWFKDQNLIDAPALNTGDGPDSADDYNLRKRGKRHDYFTSALPWPQKGDTVDLPIGTSAPVISNGHGFRLNDGTNAGYLYTNDGTEMRIASEASILDTGDAITPGAFTGNTKVLGVSNVDSGMIADLTEATAATINEFREAMQIQRFYERQARAGTRYTEIIRSFFGVISPDARLQRPEFLGSSSTRIHVQAVAQTGAQQFDTADDPIGTPQGNLAAFGLATDGSGGFHKSFTEHCIIMGIANVRADLTYQQGIPRMFSRQTKFDYYWPVFAHLGEQEILQKELYFSNNPTADNTVFGYQERYAEYRYYPSKITGQFRSSLPAPLDSWHLSEYFTSPPTLSQEFIESNTPIDRVVAVADEPHFKLDCYFDLKCARPMPVYSVPGLVDHF